MTLTALLLAGGESRRMGTDKATLMLAGEPLWQRQMRCLRELSPHALWVSARTRPAWCPKDVPVVMDAPRSRGPLSGIAAALALLRTSHLMALAIDLPQMTGAHLRKLSTLAEPECGVIPWTGEWFEPLCAVYPARASVLACQALEQGRLSLQKLVHALCENHLLKQYSVLDAEKAYYLNANTLANMPDEFERTKTNNPGAAS
jgi:molybdenum cofactor guanylyltransferase